MTNCLICSTPLNKYRKKAKFCSISCSSISSKRGKDISCICCKKEFYVHPCNLGKRKYCSKICADKLKSEDMEGKITLSGEIIQCGFCKKEMYKTKSRIKQNKLGIVYCSHDCQSEALKNGIAGYGFKKIEKSNKYKKHYKYNVITVNGIRTYEHRYIMQNHIGRKLTKNDVIHHINGDTKDNRIENLMLLDNKTHVEIEFKTNSRLYK